MSSITRHSGTLGFNKWMFNSSWVEWKPWICYFITNYPITSCKWAHCKSPNSVWRENCWFASSLQKCGLVTDVGDLRRSLVHSPIGEVTWGTCLYLSFITDDSVRVSQLNSPGRNRQLIIVLCSKERGLKTLAWKILTFFTFLRLWASSLWFSSCRAFLLALLNQSSASVNRLWVKATLWTD